MAQRTRPCWSASRSSPGKLEPPGAGAHEAYRDGNLATDPRNRSAALRRSCSCTAMPRSGCGCWRPTSCCSTGASSNGTGLVERLELLREERANLRQRLNFKSQAFRCAGRVRGGAENEACAPISRNARAQADGWRHLGPCYERRGGIDRCRGEAVDCAGRWAWPGRTPVPAAGSWREVAEATSGSGLRRGSGRGAGTDLHADRGVGDLSQLLHARADARPTPPTRAPACSRIARLQGRSAWSMRPRRRSPGRKDTRGRADQRARAAALIRYGRTQQELGGRRGGPAPDLAARRRNRDEREALLLRIANIRRSARRSGTMTQRTRKRGVRRSRFRRPGGSPAWKHLMAGGCADRRNGAADASVSRRTGDAPDSRSPLGRCCRRRRHARREGRAPGEAARLYSGPAGDSQCTASP